MMQAKKICNIQCKGCLDFLAEGAPVIFQRPEVVTIKRCKFSMQCRVAKAGLKQSISNAKFKFQIRNNTSLGWLEFIKFVITLQVKQTSKQLPSICEIKSEQINHKTDINKIIQLHKTTYNPIDPNGEGERERKKQD